MRPVIFLTLAALISAALLATVSDFTREPIAAAKAEMKRKAIEQIFPFEVESMKTVTKGKSVFYEVYDSKNALRGIAVEADTDKGYGGTIEILLGVSPEHRVIDYKVLSHLETPGLGDKIDKPKFRKQFHEKILEGPIWKVHKDGGFVDELTAATISSRAITDAVQNGLEQINEHYSNTAEQ
ncbi:RnfABCDGE type electron transport complex subunit G [Chlorobium limicola]|uniref:Ion-translocating oxidoreductase complex subunit G n=1 Tax=Chlorobium limicola TaxID=1092 RepID=A0A101JRE6_CHLLI|nr:RnfABCDGE type electron transport complex subunit G [Chlorobium limicola]KUL31652.1 electron transporter RnfG [Chlorobium limicola]